MKKSGRIEVKWLRESNTPLRMDFSSISSKFETPWFLTLPK